MFELFLLGSESFIVIINMCFCKIFLSFCLSPPLSLYLHIHTHRHIWLICQAGNFLMLSVWGGEPGKYVKTMLSFMLQLNLLLSHSTAPHKKKSRGLQSDELGGQMSGSLWSKKFSNSQALVFQLVWQGATCTACLQPPGRSRASPPGSEYRCSCCYSA